LRVNSLPIKSLKNNERNNLNLKIMSYKKPKRMSRKLNVKPSYQYDEFIEKIEYKLNKKFMSLCSFDREGIVETNSINLNQSFKSELKIFFNEKVRLELHPYNNGVTIHILRIQPQYQRKGIGSEIIKMILNTSNELNVSMYLIPLEIDNVPIEVLRKFYRNFGFKRESQSRYWKYNPIKVVSYSETNMTFGLVA